MADNLTGSVRFFLLLIAVVFSFSGGVLGLLSCFVPSDDMMVRGYLDAGDVYLSKAMDMRLRGKGDVAYLENLAIDSFMKAAAIGKGNPDVWVRLSAVLNRDEGHGDKAADAMNIAASIDPDAISGLRDFAPVLSYNLQLSQLGKQDILQ